LITRDRQHVARRDPWTLDDAVHAIMMGPNAYHRDPDEVRAVAADKDWPRSVTISCMISRWVLGPAVDQLG
jgi:hypothetical protein